MNSASEQNDIISEITNKSENPQSSLEMYEWYSPDKKKPKLPYLDNPVIGLIQAVSDSNSYLGSKNLTLGNFYYRQGRYKRAIENYLLNTLPESVNKKYILMNDRRESLLGIAESYLKLGDISSSINYYDQVIQSDLSDTKTQQNAIMDQELFKKLCFEIRSIYTSKLNQITNSLDIFEFVGNLLEEKSGWELAVKIVESIINK